MLWLSFHFAMLFAAIHVVFNQSANFFRNFCLTVTLVDRDNTVKIMFFL